MMVVVANHWLGWWECLFRWFGLTVAAGLTANLELLSALPVLISLIFYKFGNVQVSSDEIWL